jgi:hypothetical protein
VCAVAGIEGKTFLSMNNKHPLMRRIMTIAAGECSENRKIHVGDRKNHAGDRKNHVGDENRHVGDRSYHAGDRSYHVGDMRAIT